MSDQSSSSVTNVSEASSSQAQPQEPTTESEAEASSSSAPPPQKLCTNCSKPESDPEKPLKPCTKCQSVQYCSRECQKNDFKKHKKTCAAAAQIYAQSADIKLAQPLRAPKDGFRGGLQKWQFDT